ncbi:zinc ribbon domain-containing protein [Halobacillus aidingensis]|uniref:Zinc-ribbon domain-containing protein n=1 Tax=Halobacillus aidingensis TaxID=240303 RepID=A0A1H0H886_HALAD|nr:zinc ribbon domain-containing protein [Halobacillus aidingensis]SDO15379.1 hypothetical protein SAMN05421677_10388 [Halobacillus aidingensis]
MKNFCNNCGEKVVEGNHYCVKCGKRVLTSQPKKPLQKAKGNARKKRSLYVFGLIGIILISIISYYVWEAASNKGTHRQGEGADQEQTEDQQVEENGNISEETKVEEKKATAPTVEDGEVETKSSNENQDSLSVTSDNDEQNELFFLYEEELNQLSNVHPYDLGDWKIEDNEDHIWIHLQDIKGDGLKELYRSYDAQEYETLRAWAQHIFYIAQEVQKETGIHTKFTIETMCDSLAPETMFSSNILETSGSCGYSIPILTGNTKEDLSLFLHTLVFKDEEEILARDFDVPSEVESIREKYNQIKENEHLYNEFEVSADVTEYENENGVRKKLIQEIFNGTRVESYYGDDGELLFIFTSDHQNKENRYYFKDGLLIRWIDPSGDQTDAGNETEEYLKLNHYWQSELEKWKEDYFY